MNWDLFWIYYLTIDIFLALKMKYVRELNVTVLSLKMALHSQFKSMSLEFSELLSVHIAGFPSVTFTLEHI